MELLHYIPVLTTLLSAYFFYVIFYHYKQKPKTYLWWWMIGVLTFGLGTLAESINTVLGWYNPNVRFWYIIGALLGGFPLAQGTVYLLMKKKVADLLTIVFVLLIVVASVFVVLTPIDISLAHDGRLTGRVFEWQWVRRFSPFINLYAFIFLFGGAIFSAIKYYRQGKTNARFLGNMFIAIGALLPGIGGSFTRFGYVEVLYVTELLGLLCIFYGYTIIKQDPSVSVHRVQNLVTT